MGSCGAVGGKKRWGVMSSKNLAPTRQDAKEKRKKIQYRMLVCVEDSDATVINAQSRVIEEFGGLVEMSPSLRCSVATELEDGAF